jgi:hypothetical protein
MKVPGAVVFLIFLAVVLVLARGRQTEAPRDVKLSQIQQKQDLIFAPAAVDLGEVAAGQKKAAKLEVKNPNVYQVKVLSVSTSCGCTSANLEGESASVLLPPGSVRTLQIEFDAAMHESGDSVNHEIYLLVDKPLDKEYVIKLTGKVL